MSEKPIPRGHYLKMLHAARDKPLVKIITGIRRCGKSTLVEMFISDLKESGVPDEKILHMNFEDKDYINITDWNTLLKEVTDRVELKKGTYLFFDEIQEVTGWEKAVNSMRYSGTDVYITGSNSKLLSSDYSTYLSGRYFEMEVYPLSFREYLTFVDRPEDRERHLSEYMMNGGMPLAVLERKNGTNADKILSAIFETAFIKDVVERNKIMDVPAIRNITKFVMKNIGNETSTRSASNYIISKGGKISPPTADTYLDHLEAAYLIYRAEKYDTKTKEYLRTANKFYISDIGIRNNEVGYDVNDTSGLMENIVFMELLFRGKKVAVGKVDGNEIDFVVIGKAHKEYYQVTQGFFDQDVIDREIKPLKKITDGSPRTMITYQRYPFKEMEGIRVMSLADFLLEDI